MRAVSPTVPIVMALGSVPCRACQINVPIIQKPNMPHRQTFEHGRRRTIAERHADYEKADRIVQCIAEKVERVRLERRRTGRYARSVEDGDTIYCCAHCAQQSGDMRRVPAFCRRKRAAQSAAAETAAVFGLEVSGSARHEAGSVGRRITAPGI
jgi:hypothetical protein